MRVTLSLMYNDSVTVSTNDRLALGISVADKLCTINISDDSNDDAQLND